MFFTEFNAIKLLSFAVNTAMKRLLYNFIYSILFALSKLPMWVLYLKSDVLFFFAYHIFGYRKKVIRENLQLAFPEKTDKEKNKIAKDFIEHLCDLIVENIKIISISEAEIKKRFKVENIDLITDYYEKDKSLILMTGHYGNWEWSNIIKKLTDYDIFAVYKPLDNTYFDTLIKNIRSRFGTNLVTNRYIVPTLYRKSKKGEKSLTYILSDQTPKLNAYKHTDTFMGVRVPVFTGPEELAKKLDLAVLYLKINKVKRGYYIATFVPLTDEPKTLPDFEITRKFFDVIEKQIKEKPAYYLWSHKRWKHRHRI